MHPQPSFFLLSCVSQWPLFLSSTLSLMLKENLQEKEKVREREGEQLSLLIFDPDEHKWQLEGARKVTLLPEGLPL